MHFLLFMEKMAGYGAQTLFSAERIQQDSRAGFFFLARIFVGYEKKPFGYMSNDK